MVAAVVFTRETQRYAEMTQGKPDRASWTRNDDSQGQIAGGYRKPASCVAGALDTWRPISVRHRGAALDCRGAVRVAARAAVVGFALYSLAAPQTRAHSARLSHVHVFPAYWLVFISFLHADSFDREAARGVFIHHRVLVCGKCSL